jgi:hypothetical protein
MLGMYAAFLFQYFFKNQYLRAGAAAAIVFVLFYTSPLLHMRWYMDNPDPAVVQAQQYASALKVLNAMPLAQVVWADEGLSLYIPIYTTNSAPNNSFAAYYLNPETLYEDTLFLEYRLLDETPDTIHGSLVKDRETVSLRLFGQYYREVGVSLASIPDSILADLVQKYRAFYTRPFADIFRELGITVIVAPTAEKATYDHIPVLHLFASVGSYNVYTVAQ